MADIIQIRRDTAANWTSTNPTLAQGEMGYETDTGKLKFGDGTTAWTGLSYYFGSYNFLESGDNISELNNNIGYTTNTGDVTLTGTQTLTNKTLTAPDLTDPSVTSGTITEDTTQTIYVSGSIFSPYVIDPSLGSIQTHLISGISHYYDDGLSLGQAVTLHLVLSGSPSVFWPTMTWVNNGGSAPTLASLTIVSLWKTYNDSDTATLYGALVGDGS